ncbi:unnamed protein product [Chondrus crispus]|uniref:Uncharacterized protein n=1 Tax=Chondrus crispus TaxID=2769 RepID=R7QDJ6_CHOCR|nr:unnamed protein product [Chondrus crispus]CDF35480.1 unnamed protein product [Chondrus crispus]|eukprot:XP_005715299.1 unnamed protein product [Chondrus crispus]
MVSIVNVIALVALLALAKASIVSPLHKTDGIRASNQLPLLNLSAKMEMDGEILADLIPTSPESEPPMEKQPLFVFRNSTVGFTRISGAGVSVTSGAGASLGFSFSIEALNATLLQENSVVFRRRLTMEENVSYTELVRNYSGGLNMPFMETIGANLDMNVTRDDLTESFNSQSNYNSKARAARNVLTADPPTMLTLSGSIMVSGNSIIPKTFFPFAKVAQVQLNNGTSVVVVSTDPKDIVAATAEGFTTESAPVPEE